MAPKSDHLEPTEFADSASKQQTRSNCVHQPTNGDLSSPSELNSTPQERQEDADRQTRASKSFKKWKCRLRVFFCCLGYKKNKDSITDVASLFAEFYDDLKVSSSEFMAGILLLSKYQAAQREWVVENKDSNVEQYLSSIPIRPSSKFFDVSIAEDSHLASDLIYYMDYSLAIFGWPISMLDDPCKICCLFPFMRFSTCSSNHGRVQPANEGKSKEQTGGKGAKGKSSRDKMDQMDAKHNLDSGDSIHNSHKLYESYDKPIILQDNCCGCNTASVESRLSDHNYETIYVTYRVDVSVVPFLVVADHSKRTIVVAIRGSMSLADVVTDMNGLVDKIPVDDCPADWHSHRGITKAASNVKSVISQEHILDRAFNCRPDLGSQDYTLVLCGHSLGAGVAAILGILLRKHYPTLRAYLYSPPGGILCLPAAEYTKEFAVSVVLGNDIVPRLGVAQLERLRYHVLLSLKSSRQSPAKIIAKALCPSCCCASSKQIDYDPNESIDLLNGTSARPFEFAGAEVPFQVQKEVLYVPGRVLHIVRNYAFRTRAHRLLDAPIYQAIWSDNTAYDRIMVGEGMFRDHLPNHVMDAMKMLFYKTLPARKEVIPTTTDLPTSDSRSATTRDWATDQESRAQAEQAYDTKFTAKSDEQNIVIEDENNNTIASRDDINNNNIDGDNYIPADIYVKPNSARDSGSSESGVVPDAKLMTQVGLDSNGNDESIANNNYPQ